MDFAETANDVAMEAIDGGERAFYHSRSLKLCLSLLFVLCFGHLSLEIFILLSSISLFQ